MKDDIDEINPLIEEIAAQLKRVRDFVPNNYVKTTNLIKAIQQIKDVLERIIIVAVVEI